MRWIIVAFLTHSCRQVVSTTLIKLLWAATSLEWVFSNVIFFLYFRFWAQILFTIQYAIHVFSPIIWLLHSWQLDTYLTLINKVNCKHVCNWYHSVVAWEQTANSASEILKCVTCNNIGAVCTTPQLNRKGFCTCKITCFSVVCLLHCVQNILSYTAHCPPYSDQSCRLTVSDSLNVMWTYLSAVQPPCKLVKWELLECDNMITYSLVLYGFLLAAACWEMIFIPGITICLPAVKYQWCKP